MSICDTVDFIAVLVSQSAKAFGVDLECQVTLVDIQSRNRSLVDKLASAEEEIKKLRVENIKDTTKLDSSLAEIEALKREVHESQCKVASLTKKVETSNTHQKFT